MPSLAASSLRSTLLLFLSIAAHAATATSSKPSRYPLRIHVLASDSSYKTPRMSPTDAVACDAIDGAVSTYSFNAAGPVVVSGPISISGLSGDPCSLHPEMVTGRLGISLDDPIYSGEGRADLVSPPATTQGFAFRYDDCTRVRVRTGFQSLPARWKKPGHRLEVLFPSDDIPVNGRPLPPIRCSLTITALHDFVYLLLRNGKLIEVSQDEYWKHPALRIFLSGVPENLQQRPQQFTVSAHPTQTSH